jgi:N-acyl-D-aspartate/D-glutamate deacylase
MADDYDLLIKNAAIVDGTGSKSYKGSVAVEGGRIAAVGKVDGGASEVIDAGGRVVSPGFIDVHNHGDLSILYYPEAEGYLRQGITTFVGGNCGSSPAPFGDLVKVSFFLGDLLGELNPDMYYPEGLLPRDVVNERHREMYGWEIDWSTMGEFMGRVESSGLSPNYVPLVGHNQVREAVMGSDFRRTAVDAEVEEMKVHVRQAMEDGCRGFSVGRDYESSIYANLDEIVALSKIAAEYGGIYTSHSLRTGLRKARRLGEFPPVKISGLLEAIDVGRKAKIPVQVSHLGTLYDVTPRGNAELSEAAAGATLKILDNATEEGIEVHFDTIPNNRGYGTSTSLWLATSLLPWLKVAGSREQLARALRMGEFREEIKATIWSGKYYSLNPNINPGWAKMKHVMESKEEQFVDKTVAQIAEESGVDPLDALFDIIVADPDAKVGGRRFDDPTKMIFYKHSSCMVGIDTFAVDTSHRMESMPWSLPSENSFGGFPNFFRTTVVDSDILKLEEAVWRVTGLSAKKFRLEGRGLLKPGAYADIVVMDLDRVANKATALNPCVYPDGIDHVVVNGTVVVRESRHTGARPGKVLFRKK